MKNLTKIFILLIVNIFTINLFAQSPEAFKYQAIARDASGNVIANQNVSFRISILKTSETGTPVYVETHNLTTNNFGLANLNIGNGSPISGNFSTIDWATDKYFIKVEMDATGGTSYQLMGTSQLLSVPYALNAKSAETTIDGWNLSGNTGILSSNFLGTTDNMNLVIKTNNLERMRITTKGQIETYNTGESVFIGEGVGANDDLTDNGNVFIGYKSGYFNTTGNYNTANGFSALYFNTTGNYNTANGAATLYSNTTGWYNTANGYASLYSNITGNYNTANGFSALIFNTTGNYNTANGSEALYNNTEGYDNTANGLQALYSNTEGYDNTANGYRSLLSNITGYQNTANGANALYSNTTGSGNIANGSYSLYNNITGNENTAIGYGAFYNGDAYSNSTAIGYNTSINASNQIRLGNSSVTSIGGQVGWTTLSDMRFKKDVKENVPGLDFIMKLKPVTYYLDMDAIAKFTNTPDSLRLKDAEALKGKMLQTGFIAQDVEKAASDCGFEFSGVDAPKNENDYYGLRYAEFVVPLVKAVQEQQNTIDKQQTTIDNQQIIIDKQQTINDNQQKEIESLKSELQELRQLIIEKQKTNK